MMKLRNYKKQVCHIPPLLTKNEKYQKDKKYAADTGVPQLQKKLGGFVQVLTKDELPTIARNKREVWFPISER